MAALKDVLAWVVTTLLTLGITVAANQILDNGKWDHLWTGIALALWSLLTVATNHRIRSCGDRRSARRRRPEAVDGGGGSPGAVQARPAVLALVDNRSDGAGHPVRRLPRGKGAQLGVGPS
ncbi:hypothetical protein [Herbidospora sp. RD11066]